MRANRGQIVFINSTVGLAARANLAQYAATKHQLEAIADSLREEINPQGVRVLPSSMRGNHFFADYAQHWIKRLVFDANGNVSSVNNFEPASGSPTESAVTSST